MKVIPVLLLALLSFGCGYKTPASTPPQPGVTPAIAALAPDNTNAGSANFTLTVNGSHFAGDAVVNFKGNAMPTTFISASQVTAAIPASAVTTSGAVPVTVTNPATPGTGPYGGGTMAETSQSINFQVN